MAGLATHDGSRIFTPACCQVAVRGRGPGRKSRDVHRGRCSPTARLGPTVCSSQGGGGRFAIRPWGLDLPLPSGVHVGP